MDPLIEAVIAHRLQKENAGMGRELALYDQLGPEGMRAQTDLGTLDERGALAGQQTQAQMGMLGDQLSQAQQFSQPVGRNFGTVGGNVAGGIGDILRQFAGGMRARDIQGQQQKLLGQNQATQSGFLNQKDAGRSAYASARAEAMRQYMAQRAAQQQLPPMPVNASGPSFGLQWPQLDPSLYGG